MSFMTQAVNGIKSTMKSAGMNAAAFGLGASQRSGLLRSGKYVGSAWKAAGSDALGAFKVGRASGVRAFGQNIKPGIGAGVAAGAYGGASALGRYMMKGNTIAQPMVAASVGLAASGVAWGLGMADDENNYSNMGR